MPKFIFLGLIIIQSLIHVLGFVKAFNLAKLEQLIQSICNIIQVITWNDYGEGTMIEPTVEFGYRFFS